RSGQSRCLIESAFWQISRGRSRLSPNAKSNNGMHPTADTRAFIFGNLVGRRVMPGVRTA
ncbi:MAG: hypothetical protein M3362_20445, partial [Acidobacteriota bacterium]|nr:hypothetical protein [Acidobacteriota bacterium]